MLSFRGPFLVVLMLSGLPMTARAQVQLEPFPHDAERLEALRKERRDWYHELFTNAYELAGKNDPKWDQAARLG